MESICRIRKNTFENCRKAYLLIMVFLLSCRYVGVYSLAPGKIDAFLFSGLAFCGVLLLAVGAFLNYIDFSLSQNKWLFFFLMVFIISSIVNCNYGVFGNLKCFIWTLITFSIVFINPKDFSYDKQKKLIIDIQNILIYFWIILSLFSILTFILGISREELVVGKQHEIFRLGFVEARLFGVFTNPNRGSSVAFLTLIFSFFRLFENNKKRHKNWIHILNIIIQSIYISLANSRGTLLSLLVTCSAVIFIFLGKNKSFNYFILKFIRSNSEIFKTICRMAAYVCVIVGCCLFIYFIDSKIRDVFSYIPSLVKTIGMGDISKKDTLNRTQVVRMDFISNGDVSNLRFGIWENSWEIFKSNWLLGVSPSNVLSYATTFFPHKIIAMRKYSRIHNAYFDVLLSTGILGSFTIMIFYFKNMLKIIRSYTKKVLNFNDPVLNSCNATIIFIMFYGLFESEILFVNTVCSFAFWSFFSLSLEAVKNRDLTLER